MALDDIGGPRYSEGGQKTTSRRGLAMARRPQFLSVQKVDGLLSPAAAR